MIIRWDWGHTCNTGQRDVESRRTLPEENRRGGTRGVPEVAMFEWAGSSDAGAVLSYPCSLLSLPGSYSGGNRVYWCTRQQPLYTRAVRARHIASSSCESAVLVVILSIGDSDFTILGGAAGQMNKLEATAVPCETDTATPVLVELVSWRPNLSLLPPAPTAPPLPRAPAPQPPSPMTAACGAAWWQIGAPSGVSWLSRKNVLAAVAWRGKMPSACQLVDQLG